ncbi:MAG: hypothetical protein Q9218_003844 [Villophora microphyllina]
MELFNLDVVLILLFYLYSSAYSVPAVFSNPLGLTNTSHLLLGKPDLSPMIYHIPHTHNTLYIQTTATPLPPSALAATLWNARVFVTNQIAILQGNADVPLPSDMDPGHYQAGGSVVKVSWQSSSADKKMTWGDLRATLRGLHDCLVKNQQESVVNVWHVFGMMGELGWGQIESATRKKG